MITNGALHVHEPRIHMHTYIRAPVSQKGQGDGIAGLPWGCCVPYCSCGGRGVHVISMVPGSQCALLMRTSACLHGSIVPTEGPVHGMGLADLDFLRVITYPLSRVEVLLKRLSLDPDRAEVVRRLSHSWLQKRMRAW